MLTESLSDFTDCRDMASSKLFAGRYRIEKLLGKGATGKVLLCIDTVLEKNVAVKVLKDTTDPDVIKRFHEEARAAAKLKHSNILDVYDIGVTDDGKLYLVMEYLPGDNLEQVLKRQGRLEFDLACGILIQICRGLAYAHQNGIIHRDVKPSNIVMGTTDSGENYLKIVDFGVAKRIEVDQKITTTGGVIGTPSYMSPETARGEKVDCRADVYSLGCIFFEMLTGVKPFVSNSSIETIYMHLNEKAPLLKEKGKFEYDQFLESMVAKCLEKNRDDRYQTIEEFLRALELYESGHHKDEGLVSQTIPAQSENYWRNRLFIIVPAVLVFVVSGMYLFQYLYSARTDSELNKKEREYFPPIFKPTTASSVEEDTELKNFSSVPGEFKIGVFGKVEKFPSLLQRIRKEKVKKLTWEHSKLVGPGSESFANLEIDILNIRGSEIDDRTLQAISKIKTLKTLSMEVVRGDFLKSIDCLSNLKNLEIIELTSTAVDDSIFEVLADCPRLHTLILRLCPNIRGKGIDKLAQIEVLILARSGFEPRNFALLLSLNNLINIDLADLDFEDRDLKTITKSRIEYLLLCRNQKLTRKGFLSLQNLKTLKVLVILDCKNQSDEILKKLSIKLPRCQVSRYGASFVKGLKFQNTFSPNQNNYLKEVFNHKSK